VLAGGGKLMGGGREEEILGLKGRFCFSWSKGLEEEGGVCNQMVLWGGSGHVMN